MRSVIGLATGLMSLVFSCSAWSQVPPPLKAPEDFNFLADPTARSKALFVEAGKVLSSPRCQNCHPNGDRPTQADDMHLHLPKVVRGRGDTGATALRCMTCHTRENFEPAGMPGNPKWRLAPLSMAWQGKTLAQICEQLKDSNRNGRRSLAQIAEHIGHDDLVGWAWHPGGDRTPAAGTQEQFGRLISAWVATGAACPAGAAP